MSESFTDEELHELLATTQQIVTAVPKGPWPVDTGAEGGPFAVGPICWLETYDGDHQLPVVQLVAHARDALAQYVGIVSRQQTRIRDLEVRVRQLEGGGDRG